MIKMTEMIKLIDKESDNIEKIYKQALNKKCY